MPPIDDAEVHDSVALIRQMNAEEARRGRDLCKVKLEDAKLRLQLLRTKPYNSRPNYKGSSNDRLDERHESELVTRLTLFLSAYEDRGERKAKRKKGKLELKREGVIFGAIQARLRGLKYCAELDRKRLAIPAAWMENGCPNTYVEAYKRDWSKRIQDEKHRFKVKYANTNGPQLEKTINDSTR